MECCEFREREGGRVDGTGEVGKVERPIGGECTRGCGRWVVGCWSRAG